MASYVKLSGNVFVTGDYHFNHGNIIRYCNRPFKNSQEMDTALIDNTNRTVKSDDTLICVGDFMFPGRGNDYYTLAKSYRSRIACKNIYFVWGNHDRPPAMDQIMQSFYRLQNIDLRVRGNEQIKDLSITQLQAIAEELRQVQEYAWSIRNVGFTKLFKHCCDLLEIEVDGQQAVFGHYAYRVWNKSHRGRWMLYGHSHGSLPDDPNALSIDVGVDAHAFRLAGDKSKLRAEDYRPLSWSEVAEIMKTKTFVPIDHHGT